MSGRTGKGMPAPIGLQCMNLSARINAHLPQHVQVSLMAQFEQFDDPVGHGPTLADPIPDGSRVPVQNPRNLER